RTTRPLAAMLPSLRAATRDVNPNLLLWNAETMDELPDQPLAQPRLSALIMSAFGVVALLLSGLGLYGVMSAGVRRQTRDIGVRVALGGAARDADRSGAGAAERVNGDVVPSSASEIDHRPWTMADGRPFTRLRTAT